jgi:hypothetical protein
MDTVINKSTITARITHNRVKLDLLDRGWIPIDAAEEQPFDMIVDVGIHNDARMFQTVQIKSWNALKTSSRTGAIEPVSVGGKTRNNYNYYDECIDWIATVKDNRVLYWNRNTYQYKTPIQLKKTTPIDFPFNDNVYEYARPTNSIDDAKSIESFMTGLFVDPMQSRPHSR